jgi:hypothetical protein
MGELTDRADLESRWQRNEASRRDDGMSKASQTPGYAALIIIFLMGAILGGVVGAAIGGIIGMRAMHHARNVEERDAVAPALKKDAAFKSVLIYEESGGEICLVGTVPTVADRTRLREVVTRLIGERRTGRAMASVSAGSQR